MIVTIVKNAAIAITTTTGRIITSGMKMSNGHGIVTGSNSTVTQSTGNGQRKSSGVSTGDGATNILTVFSGPIAANGAETR